ncbi:F-box protein SKIP1-like [Chenopodium quinoa]|uniref:F-box protein SKIP1-like n=1 Tax=Chenopodium quinoa TaxID=63459 RepID=UPI000B77CEF3|nr:F-box protein SKIP1-like [Chenopodium quinoa]
MNILSRPPLEENPTESTHNPDWAGLIHECLINIFSRLPLEDRWKGAMLVCKPWMEACQDSPLINNSFDLECYFETYTDSAHWWTPEFESKIDAILISAVNLSYGLLKRIRVSHCSDHALIFAAQRCPKLEVLSIKSSQSVSDATIIEVSKRCPLLKELDMSFCHKITYISFPSIGRNCPRLKLLKRNFMNLQDSSQYRGIVPNEYIDACPQGFDSEAAAIAGSMPNLLSIDLMNSGLSGKGLALISEGCLNLETLDLRGCDNLSTQNLISVLPLVM